MTLTMLVLAYVLVSFGKDKRALAVLFVFNPFPVIMAAVWVLVQLMTISQHFNDFIFVRFVLAVGSRVLVRLNN